MNSFRINIYKFKQGENDENVPHTVGHEVGHAHHTRVERMHDETTYGGTLSKFAVLNNSLKNESMSTLRKWWTKIEIALVKTKMKRLWMKDPLEQYAEDFADQHGSILPVTIDRSRIRESLPEDIDPEILADAQLRDIRSFGFFKHLKSS